MSTSAEATRSGRSATIRGLGFLIGVAFAWGLNWPVMKFLLREVPPYQMRAVSALMGAAFMMTLAALSGERLRPPGAQWRPLLLSSSLNFTAFMVCSITAMHWLSASEAVIVAYTLPIWAALIAWPVLGERPTVRRLAALVIGLSGVMLLMAGELRVSWDKLPGVAFGLAGAILFALGMILSKRRPVAMPPISNVAWQVLFSVPPMLLLAFGLERLDFARMTPLGWAALIYLATVPLCLAYLMWFRALRLLPASTAAVGTLLVPIVGVFASAAMLGDPLGTRELGALALTLCGVALAARA